MPRKSTHPQRLSWLGGTTREQGKVHFGAGVRSGYDSSFAHWPKIIEDRLDMFGQYANGGFERL